MQKACNRCNLLYAEALCPNCNCPEYRLVEDDKMNMTFNVPTKIEKACEKKNDRTTRYGLQNPQLFVSTIANENKTAQKGALVSSNGKILAIVPTDIETTGKTETSNRYTVPANVLPTRKTGKRLVRKEESENGFTGWHNVQADKYHREEDNDEKFPNVRAVLPAWKDKDARTNITIDADLFHNLAQAICDITEPTKRVTLHIDTKGTKDKGIILTCGDNVGVLMPMSNEDNLSEEKYANVISILENAADDTQKEHA